MPDEIVSNLEPIEESDLDLAGKFKEEKKEGSVPGEPIEKKLEDLSLSENKAEAPEKAKEKESAYTKILSKVQSTTTPAKQDAKTISDDAEIVSLEKDVEGKIVSLLNIAQKSGVVHAVEVARHLEDNYVLDELHDRMLGEELHHALLEKGLIKEI